LQEEQEQSVGLGREDLAPLPQFSFSVEDHSCKRCSRQLHARRTRSRKVISIIYGTFSASEQHGYCPHHSKLPSTRPRELSQIVAPGTNHAYDVIVQVGLERFLKCRQNEEIRIELSRNFGIELSVGTISHLALKFLAYLSTVHKESTRLLRADMHHRGGYILHIDGTCEGGSGVLLVCLDSMSGQVIESRKISSENHKEVKGVLKDVRRNWGIPLAIVHDMRRALISASGEVFKGVPQFICHYHFAADVGKDILSPHADRLRKLFRSTGVRPKLRALIRSLKDFATAKDTSDHRVTDILQLRSTKGLRNHCTPEAAKGAVHALASWILEYHQDGEGYGFPFDMPYLNLYKRIVNVHKELCQTIKIWPKRKRGPLGTLMRLKEILDKVMQSENTPEFRKIVKEIKRDLLIFEQFRSALRICPKGGKHRRRDEGTPRMLSKRRHKEILKKLRAALQRKICSNSSSKRASEIVVKHLNKYWNLLFGHVLRKGTKKIVVPRTNNVEEGLFGIVKRQCRRLHGRGHLSRDIEVMSPAAPLVMNLRNTSYCDTVFGGKEPVKIVRRFSSVDPKTPAKLLKTWRQEKVSTQLPRKLVRLKSLPRKVARFLSVAVKELKE